MDEISKNVYELLSEMEAGIIQEDGLTFEQFYSAVLYCYRRHRLSENGLEVNSPIVKLEVVGPEVWAANYFTAGFLFAMRTGRLEEFCKKWDDGETIHFEEGDSISWVDEKFYYHPVVPLDHIKVDFVVSDQFASD